MARVYKSDSIDENVTDAEMSDMSNMLDKFGIKVREASGSYRNFGDILNDVAKAEEGMTDSQKMAINTQASGVLNCLALPTRNSWVIKFLRKTGRLSYFIIIS